MDIDQLRTAILAGQCRYTVHAFVRVNQRQVTMPAIRASFATGCDLVEQYAGGKRALVLTRLPNKRPLHTVWVWGTGGMAELVTVYQPDEPAYRVMWTNGYRTRVRPNQP